MQSTVAKHSEGVRVFKVHIFKNLISIHVSLHYDVRRTFINCMVVGILVIYCVLTGFQLLTWLVVR